MPHALPMPQVRDERSVGAALALARERGVPRHESRWLLAHVLQREVAWLLAHDDALLDDAQQARFAATLSRLAQGEPLAYVLESWTFCGLRLRVTPDVLIPRPETEALVDWAADRLEAWRAPGVQVADLGTGSGAIALALKTRCPWVDLVATDLSTAALAVARANADALGLPLRFAQGRWFEPLAGQRFALIVSNPPYVAEHDLRLAALAPEPRQALVAHANGMADVLHICQEAGTYLLPGGWLMLEHGHEHGEAAARALRSAGFDAIECRCDLAGLPRHSAGQWGGPARD